VSDVEFEASWSRTFGPATDAPNDARLARPERDGGGDGVPLVDRIERGCSPGDVVSGEVM